MTQEQEQRKFVNTLKRLGNTDAFYQDLCYNIKIKGNKEGNSAWVGKAIHIEGNVFIYLPAAAGEHFKEDVGEL